MIIPKRITVGKTAYVVEYMSTLPPHYFGRLCSDKKRITIARGNAYGRYTPERMQETFLHELLHACMFDMGLRKHDEDFINGLAKRLLNAFDSAEL